MKILLKTEYFEEEEILFGDPMVGTSRKQCGRGKDPMGRHFSPFQGGRDEYEDEEDEEEEEEEEEEEDDQDVHCDVSSKNQNKKDDKWRLIRGIKGGPSNPELLSGFQAHVAYYIWNGQVIINL